MVIIERFEKMKEDDRNNLSAEERAKLIAKEILGIKEPKNDDKKTTRET